MQQKMPSVNLNSRTSEGRGTLVSVSQKMCQGHRSIALALALALFSSCHLKLEKANVDSV